MMVMEQERGAAADPAALFAIIWDTLVDVLGTASVAAIVRRSARRAAAESPELLQLAIVREELDYRYALPESWAAKETQPIALRLLAREIGRLLEELTGRVVVSRLEELPALQGRGLVWRGEEST